MPEFVVEAWWDSLRVLPSLLLIFFLLEYGEHRLGRSAAEKLKKAGRLGPLWGALLGLLPHGLGVAAAVLYARRVISAGTAVAVFIATSDEALPVLLAHPRGSVYLFPVIAVKMVIAVLFGFIFDFLLHALAGVAGGEAAAARGTDDLDEENLYCPRKWAEKNRREEKTRAEPSRDAERKEMKEIIREAVGHAAKVWFYVFLFTIIFAGAVELVGIEKLRLFFLSRSPWQPVLSALVGVIPGCAVSVFLAQLFLDRVISFGSVIAGLTTASGMGLVMLWKENGSFRENLLITLYIIAVAAITGLFFQLIL